MSLGEKFCANLWPLKEAWSKHLAEQDKLGPWRQIWEAQAVLNAELDRLDALDDPITARWVDARPMAGTPLEVCECGVAITGGLHSDWCPLVKENDV